MQQVCVCLQLGMFHLLTNRNIWFLLVIFLRSTQVFVSQCMGMLVFSKIKKHPNKFLIIFWFYVVRSREKGSECELLSRELSVDSMTISSHHHHYYDYYFLVPRYFWTNCILILPISKSTSIITINYTFEVCSCNCSYYLPTAQRISQFNFSSNQVFD